ncbi:MAG TPA: shikimate dehydrogenase [Terriglobales bacterium]|nr:shikimate dehydrogenase [Terriglobales bacterium]
MAVQAPTVGELLDRAERASRETTLLELRLDSLKLPSAAMGPLREFLRSSPQTLVIATCRKQTYGGGFKGSAEAEWRILHDAALAGCALVDIELQSAERLAAGALSELRQHTNLIVSYHDFKTTPPLAPLLKRMRAIPADLYKLVPTASTWRQNIELLRFVDANSGPQALVAFCMGEVGLLSRLLSLRVGGAFTFAALEADEATASGQPDIEALRNLYRMDTLNRATRIYGVLGYPLAHSLSPRMHNAAYRRTGENALYLPLPSRRPTDVLDFADDIPLSGFSVTHPYKSAFLDRLERMDPIAKAVGAINTVVRSQGKFYGYNTDVAGIVEPLAQALPLRGAKILVLGAGGAARAAVFGLRSRGAQVFIHNRTRQRAQALAAAAKAKVVGRQELKKLEFQAIVHATPVGQYPKVKESPLAADEIHAPVVFDLVYNPLETELARLARAGGARVIPGMEMFVLQGARQFELWTGKPAPVEEMRREVLAALTELAD